MPNIMINKQPITVPPGTPLLEAARQAGIPADVPCGGKGVCGKCLVMVTGPVEQDGRVLNGGEVMLCRARVCDVDITVTVPLGVRSEQGKFSCGREDLDRVDPALLPRSGDMGLVVKTAALTVPAPRAGDGLSDLDRLCLAARDTLGCAGLRLPLDVLRNLPEALRRDGGQVRLLYRRDGGALYAVDLLPPGESVIAGAAIDIGTTTVAVMLADGEGNLLAEKTAYNLQAECGLDVISRINYARSPERLTELRDKVLQTVNKLLSELAEASGIGTHNIVCASVAANTTMVHLLLGLPPEYIRLDPYTPAVYTVPVFTAGETGLGIHPNAPLDIAPAVGSYVGGDITSGLLCTSFAQNRDDISLFIDIGTNGEIVLGGRDFLMGCACSAGPAFEGGGIRCGMRASKGAIEHVSVDGATGKPSCTVIGGGEPSGICGSGMIALMAALLREGFCTPAGKLHGRESAYIQSGGKNARYYLSDEVFVSEADIDNFIRAKAAIFSACRVLLGSVGMDFSDLSAIYIAGGFGRYLDIVNSKTIGLLPNLPFEKFIFLGNSSLAGAYMTLLSEPHREKRDEMARKVTYMDLSAEPGYMDEYVAALFLPHTDFELFRDIYSVTPKTHNVRSTSYCHPAQG